MPRLIVATFDTQFAAASATDKLLSHGMQRSHVVACVNESVGNSAASASSPTSVISPINPSGRREDQRTSEIRSPSHLPGPAQFGHTVLTVTLDDDVPADDVWYLMELVGAKSIEMLDGNAPTEDPMMWPVHGKGSAIDVGRAISAARGGEPLGSRSRR